MEERQAHATASTKSKGGEPMFVVWIPGEGYDAFDAKQTRIYAPLVFIEATYISGCRIPAESVSQ